VIDSCPVMTEPKTKTLGQFWERMAKKGEKCLLVVESFDEALYKSIRNLPRLFVTTASNLNTYDAINVERIIFTEAALQVFEKAE